MKRFFITTVLFYSSILSAETIYDRNPSSIYSSVKCWQAESLIINESNILPDSLVKKMEKGLLTLSFKQKSKNSITHIITSKESLCLIKEDKQ